MSKKEEDPLVGLTLKDRYAVRRHLASGGMARVYVAQDVLLNKDVVVKIPKPTLLADPTFRSRFMAEVESLKRLDHRGIVRILDLGEHEQVPYMVLPFLSGGTLQDRLDATDKPMAVSEVTTWLRDLAEALDYLHGEGFIHRDIKPGNILFDQSGYAFLGDFGIVRTADRVGTHTATGHVVGTTQYMGPEIATGQAITAAYDQYALGVVVYACLAREIPLDSPSTPIQVIMRRAREDVPALDAVALHVTPEVSEVVMQALAREPDDRFPTCGEFASAFRRASLSGSGIRSGPRRKVTRLPAPEPRPPRGNEAPTQEIAGGPIISKRPAAGGPPPGAPAPPPPERPPGPGRPPAAKTSLPDSEVRPTRLRPPDPDRVDGPGEAKPDRVRPRRPPRRPVRGAPAPTGEPSPGVAVRPPPPRRPVPRGPAPSLAQPSPGPATTGPVAATIPGPSLRREWWVFGALAAVNALLLVWHLSPVLDWPSFERLPPVAGLDRFLRPTDRAEMVEVQAGVTRFLLDREPVTWSRYYRYMEARRIAEAPVPPDAGPDDPAVFIDADDAAAYCAWAAAGRLPLEEEWQLARTQPAGAVTTDGSATGEWLAGGERGRATVRTRAGRHHDVASGLALQDVGFRCAVPHAGG